MRGPVLEGTLLRAGPASLSPAKPDRIGAALSFHVARLAASPERDTRPHPESPAAERALVPIEMAPYDNGDACGLVVAGDVDIAAVPELESRLDAAIRDTVGAFVIDLAGVEFMDSSGLSVVLRARALLARDERALAVIAPEGPVRRLFELSGVADLLVIFDSRDAVSAHLVPAGRGG